MHNPQLSLPERALLTKAANGIVTGLTLVANEPYENNEELNELIPYLVSPDEAITNQVVASLVRWRHLRDNPEQILEEINTTEALGLFMLIAETIIANGLGGTRKRLLALLYDRASMSQLVEEAKDHLLLN